MVEAEGHSGRGRDDMLAHASLQDTSPGAPQSVHSSGHSAPPSSGKDHSSARDPFWYHSLDSEPPRNHTPGPYSLNLLHGNNADTILRPHPTLEKSSFGLRGKRRDSPCCSLLREGSPHTSQDLGCGLGMWVCISTD